MAAARLFAENPFFYYNKKQKTERMDGAMAEHTELMTKLLRKTIEEKDAQIAGLKETVTRLNATIDTLNSTVANLNETIEEMRRKIFGVSSERTSRKQKPADDEPGESTETVTVRNHTRAKSKPKSTREDLYAKLPVVEVRCPVPDDQRLCPDCDTPMETLGWQYVREELRITPAIVERVHYMQETLVCPACREEDDTTIVKAPMPTALLPHSPASPSMVAYVMYEKFVNDVPFYRQEMDWLQKGTPLARETTSNWCIKCALEYFQPVYDRLHVHLVEREILHADETVCQVLHEDKKAASSKSYMWIYLTGNDGQPAIILFEYQPGRNGDYARDFLEGFSGLLECDGYTGYNKVDNVTLVCCLAHCRRYFYEAVPAARRRKMKLLDVNSPEEIPEEAASPDKAKEEKKTPAEIGVHYCNQLFKVERTLKDLPADERKTKRLELETPIWDSFWSWLATVKPAGGSLLEKAVNYAGNHKGLLGNYMLDGRCEISNNRAERQAKSYGTGRKNFLFHNSVNGAKSSAIIYSLVETAKANHLNIYQYLYTLLLYMPDYKNEPAGVEAMMPWSDFIKERCSGVMDTKTETPENRGQLSI
ncbi:MAG: IS66 family transposase [Oscillospiraceae bacterium]|nr:IS66 family transposase [Oscillospiraceae bacterium]